MSTLRVSNIQDTSGGNTSTPAAIANGIAKAWVNFNGTGTVAIRANYNVSSITDNGAGDYTVNFTTALTNGNYAVALSSTGFNATTNQARIIQVLGDQSTGATLKSSTQLRVVRGLTNTTGAYEDSAEVSVAVFR